MASIAMLGLALYGQWRMVKRKRARAESRVFQEDYGAVPLYGSWLSRYYWTIATIWCAIILSVWIFCYSIWLEMFNVDFYARTIGALTLATGGPFILSLLGMGGTALAMHLWADSEEQREEYLRLGFLFIISFCLSAVLYLLLMFPGSMIIERIARDAA